MAEHTSRVNWFERLRDKRRQRKAKAAASIHANRGSEAVWSARAGRPAARRAGSEATAASAACEIGRKWIGAASMPPWGCRPWGKGFCRFSLPPLDTACVRALNGSLQRICEVRVAAALRQLRH